MGILQAKIQLIASGLSRIDTGKRVDIGITIGIGQRPCVVAPQIRDVSTEGKTFKRLPTCTYINLMETTLTRERIGTGHVRHIFSHLGSIRIIISHIGKGDDTKAHSHMLGCPKCRHGIFKVRVLSVHLGTSFIEIGNLPRYTSVENKTQRVYRGI